MKSKLLFLFLILINAAFVEAQAPAAPTLTTTPAGVRPRGGENDPEKESSSFMGDPQNLDPLKTKKENLKEDEEPVLEDIRQVLDEPEKKKEEAVPAPEIVDSKPKIQPKPVVQKPKKKMVAKKPKPLPVKKIKQAKPYVAPVRHEVRRHDLQSDDPDFRLEKKFNNIYNAFNAQPTSVEAWSAVVGNRPSHVYIVQKGDTLWSISKTLFGDPLFWPKIWSLNRMGIVNPHFITPGLRVMFYSGTEGDVPSLAVNTSKEKETGDVQASADADVEPSLTKLDSATAPGIIPDSLPLSRNDNYFLPPKTMQVAIQNDVDAGDDYSSDILLTNDTIKSEVDVPIEEIVKGHCGGSHVIKSKIAIAPNADFRIYELLETLNTDVGAFHAYRFVGEAHSLADTKLKIQTCSTVMSSSLAFVSPSKVAGLRATKISKSPKLEILGGPNLGTQSLFSNEQLIYINMGPQPVNIGQSAFVRSQLTEQTSGEIKILDKFGSIAVGVLTQVDDLIEKGDTITLEH